MANDGNNTSVTPTSSREQTKTTSEIVKNWTEVGAFAIAGLWAATTFFMRECPNREARFDATNELNWTTDAGMSEQCTTDWRIMIKNISTKDARVEHINVYVWKFQRPSPTANAPTLLNLEELRPKSYQDPALIYNKTFDIKHDGPLTGDYGVNSSRSHTFQWVFHKQPEETWAAFEVEGFNKVGDGKRVFYEYAWSPICPPREAPECCPPGMSPASPPVH